MSKLKINSKKTKSIINRNIYGHFSEHLGRCIYDGLFVGESSFIPNENGMRTDVVQALKSLKIPVLRWPGGCFADEYHWRDGIGPKQDRKRMVNTNWGGVVEDNSFGTHEFFELCDQLGCEPYININLGSGTVREMSEWIEYMTFDGVSPLSQLRVENGREEPWHLKYLGIGNESWGCGGNMRPERYADEFRKYQSFAKSFGHSKLYKIACGAGDDDYNWTDKVMEIAGKHMDAITLHHYTVVGDWGNKGSATKFTSKEYYAAVKEALKMETLISTHAKMMDKHDPKRRIGLIVDEWGAWHNVEPGTNPGFLYQQNTMRDAIVAAATLNIFNAYSDRVVMANVAQTVNVLQAVILTEGNKMVLTPTYHVFDLYKYHQDASLAECWVETQEVGEDEARIPNLSVSASIDLNDELHITLANLSHDTASSIDCEILGKNCDSLSARILSGKMSDYNDFDSSNSIVPVDFSDFCRTGMGVEFEIPACSVMLIAVK